jgi:RNA 2',3'-cyclic 3'-phosphodiesterase
VRAFLAVEVRPASIPPDEDRPEAPSHVTLRFLGEVDDAVVVNLTRALGPVVGSQPAFEFVLEGVGAFPSHERPRVVWRGVGRGREELTALARAVRVGAVAAGLRDDPVPFVPHVTLFRVRSARDRARAADLLESGAPELPPLPVSVSEVHLKESRLTAAGAIHRTVARFPLESPGS